MPIVTLLPTTLLSAMGDYVATGAPSVPDALRSDDALTSYVEAGVALPAPAELEMEDVPPSATIVSVFVNATASGSGVPGDTLRIYARLAGVDGANAVSIVAVPSVLTTYAAALPRPGGGPWSAADLNNASCIVTMGPGDVLLTYVAWVSTHTLPAGTMIGVNRAFLTARAGWMRASSARAAFIPTATQGTTAAAGLSPGSPGGYYSWRRRYLPQTVWTPVRPLAVDR